MATYYIIAGERSGDKQGALLMQELLRENPELCFKGLGGDHMSALSGEIENWTEKAAVIGFIDVFKNIRYFKRNLDNITTKIVAEQPEALILIDYPGFNQRLAERIHEQCPATKIIWFIAPMVWAWHKGRIPKLARILDLMLCTFPFEKKLFEDAGLRTEFVGHPLVDDILAMRDSARREKQLIGLFPGSRKREIDRHFPLFLELVAAAKEKHPDWHFETSASSDRLARRMERMRKAAGVSAELINIKPGSYHDLMERSSAALVTSGTATLEAALHELPFALVYRVSPLTYLMAKLLLKVRYIGMVNILVDRPVVKELIQGEFSVENSLLELERLMQPETRALVMQEMKASVSLLGDGGAARKAAVAVRDCLS